MVGKFLLAFDLNRPCCHLNLLPVLLHQCFSTFFMELFKYRKAAVVSLLQAPFLLAAALHPSVTVAHLMDKYLK